MFSKKTISLVATIGSGFAVGSITLPANATVYPTCTPDAVSWADDFGGGSLAVHCAANNTWYFARKTFTGCASVSVDTLKTWFSLAQTAMLAGKTIEVGYVSCGGVPTILNWMEIDK